MESRQGMGRKLMYEKMNVNALMHIVKYFCASVQCGAAQVSTVLLNKMTFGGIIEVPGVVTWPIVLR